MHSHLKDLWKIVDESSGDFGPAYLLNTEEGGTEFRYRGPSSPKDYKKRTLKVPPNMELLIADRFIKKHFPDKVGNLISGLIEEKLKSVESKQRYFGIKKNIPQGEMISGDN